MKISVEIARAIQKGEKGQHPYYGIRDSRGWLTRYRPEYCKIDRSWVESFVAHGGQFDSCGVWGINPSDTVIASLGAPTTIVEIAYGAAKSIRTGYDYWTEQPVYRTNVRYDIFPAEADVNFLRDAGITVWLDAGISSKDFDAFCRGISRKKDAIKNFGIIEGSIMGLGWKTEDQFFQWQLRHAKRVPTDRPGYSGWRIQNIARHGRPEAMATYSPIGRYMVECYQKYQTRLTTRDKMWFPEGKPEYYCDPTHTRKWALLHKFANPQCEEFYFKTGAKRRLVLGDGSIIEGHPEIEGTIVQYNAYLGWIFFHPNWPTGFAMVNTDQDEPDYWSRWRAEKLPRVWVEGKRNQYWRDAPKGFENAVEWRYPVGKDTRVALWQEPITHYLVWNKEGKFAVQDEGMMRLTGVDLSEDK